METKYCRGCNKNRLLKFFFTHKAAADGLSYECRSCTVERTTAINSWRIVEGLVYEPVMTGKQCCTKCGEEKHVTKFRKNKLSKNGRSSWCSLCHNEAQKASYVYDPTQPKARYSETHPDQWRQYAAAYAKRYYANPVNAKRQVLSQRITLLKKKETIHIPAKCCECKKKAEVKATFNDNFVIKNFTHTFSNEEFLKNIEWKCNPCIYAKRKKNK